jgi:hypothetical protein
MPSGAAGRQNSHSAVRSWVQDARNGAEKLRMLVCAADNSLTKTPQQPQPWTATESTEQRLTGLLLFGSTV